MNTKDSQIETVDNIFILLNAINISHIQNARSQQINENSDVEDSLFSPAAMRLFQWIMLTVICQAINVFGIGTNIINIVCFCKQGFKDPVIVSLVGLAVSDLGSLTTVIWTNICYTPAFMESELPFDPKEFQFLITAIPHTAFTRISGWITALITLERCLCITAPLKVKSVITSKRVFLVIVFINIILIASVAPIYVVNNLGLKFYPSRNKTLIGMIFREDRVAVEQVTYAINNVFVPCSSFFVIITCTSILVFKLNTQAKWRNKSATSTQANNTSRKNQNISKMVVMISILFIACFVPLIIVFLTMSTDPSFAIDGKYVNALIVFGGVGLVLESINASSNIFIYYYMSSNYRAVFSALICTVRVHQ